MTREKFVAVLERQGIALDTATIDRVYDGRISDLLTVGNPKTLKGRKRGYGTAILHLAPALNSGFQTCPASTAACNAACLYTAGRGGFDPVIPAARKMRTYWFITRRDEFMARLAREIALHVARCEKEGFVPTVRLNGTSDIRWEAIPVGGKPNIMRLFPRVRFYDYTKLSNRTALARNYSLTLSAHEGWSDDDIAAATAAGNNVAVVFRSLELMGLSRSVQGQAQRMRKMALPATYAGVRVVDGDESDLRFLDPRGVIVGLRAKGQAVADTAGFVRDVA